MSLQLPSKFVGTATEYFDRHCIEMDWDNEHDLKKYDSINTIIALQIAHYTGRRTTGCDGSINDHVGGMVSKAKENHNENFNEEYIDENYDLI